MGLLSRAEMLNSLHSSWGAARTIDWLRIEAHHTAPHTISTMNRLPFYLYTHQDPFQAAQAT